MTIFHLKRITSRFFSIYRGYYEKGRQKPSIYIRFCVFHNRRNLTTPPHLHKKVVKSPILAELTVFRAILAPRAVFA